MTASCVDLAARFGAVYRVVYEEGTSPQALPLDERAWYLRLPGRYGIIGPYGGSLLVVWTDHPRIGTRLRRLPFVQRVRGDRETVVVFEVADFEAVVRIVRLYRRRRLSPTDHARLARIGAGTRFRKAHENFPPPAMPHDAEDMVEPGSTPRETAEALGAASPSGNDKKNSGARENARLTPHVQGSPWGVRSWDLYSTVDRRDGDASSAPLTAPPATFTRPKAEG